MTKGFTAADDRAGWLRARPSGMWRALLRLPVWLYRLRLGFLLGHRFLVITHVGRRSLRLHRTMLEVVRYRPERREAVVISPWPKHADWYLNVLARPAREIWIANDRFRPAQRILNRQETGDVLDDYVRKGRVEAAAVQRLFGWKLEATATDRERLLEGVAAVAFTPAS